MLSVIQKGGFIIANGLSAEGLKLAKKSLYGILKTTQANGLYTIKALGIKDAFKSTTKVRMG